MNDASDEMNPPPSSGETPLNGSIVSTQEADRLDVFLVKALPHLSRSRWKQYIDEGRISLNGTVITKARTAIHEGDTVAYALPPPEPVELQPNPDIELDILFEDADIIVLNKAPDLVIHPAPGHAQDTLVNALLHHCRDLQSIGGEIRPGIVHRLDKDTSGALVAAKNEQALHELQAQFQARIVQKHYLALVWGLLRPSKGTISTQIGRHPVDRLKMSTATRSGKPAVTHYDTLCSGQESSLVHLHIETGRTHQIRVHMAHRQCPIVGDTLYGRPRKYLDESGDPIEFPRQMLHAYTLKLKHPRTHRPLTFTAPLPDDFLDAVAALFPGLPIIIPEF